MRLILFAATLLALGGTYALTGSEGAQVGVLLVALFVVDPIVSRRFASDHPDELMRAVRERHPPFRVLAVSALGFCVWAGIALFLLPEAGLGPWFWFWAIMLPWFELYRALAARELRRTGAAAWRPHRPMREGAIWAAAAVPLLLPMALFDDVALGEAVAAGVALGGVILFFSIGLTFANRRSSADAR